MSCAQHLTVPRTFLWHPVLKFMLVVFTLCSGVTVSKIPEGNSLWSELKFRLCGKQSCIMSGNDLTSENCK